MKYHKYEEYKDSDANWISELPSHWGNIYIRRLTKYHNQGFYTSEDYTEEGVDLLRITDIDDNSYIRKNNPPKVSVSQYDFNRFRIDKNDFLFARSGTIGRFGVVREIDKPTIFASYLIRFKFDLVKVHSEYLRFWFQSKIFTEGLFSDLHGGANQNIHAENIKNRFAFLPTEKEQQSIANFLDKETTRLDSLITKKQQLIETLKEKRIAIISHAVTKGLKPDVPMKESEIEWLVEVPEHWEEKTLKFVSTLNDETLPETTDPEYEIKYVDIGSIDQNKGIIKKEFYIFDEAPSRARRKVINGDIIVSTVRTYLRAIAPVINPEENLIVSTGFAVVRPQKITSDYLSFLLRSKYFVEKVVSLSVGVSYPAINASVLGSIKIPIPGEDEQIQISNYVFQETQSIDKIIGLTEKHIDKLIEYKTALISAAVTGKIKVPEQA